MGNNYRLEVNETKGKFPTVRIIFIQNEYYSINKFSNLSEPLVISEVQEWCTENENGWRTSYDTFKFRNKEQLTMFILRWS